MIGGGDTGSDCVGTSNRQGAASVTQFELLPQPPECEDKPLVWPYWPIKLRTSSSHEEGCSRDWSVATKRFEGRGGKVEKLVAARVEWQTDADGKAKMVEMPSSEFELKADLVLLAMGVRRPAVRWALRRSWASLGTRAATSGRTRTTIGRRWRRSSRPATCGAGNRSSSGPFARAGNARGAVDLFLMGKTDLPR